MPTLEDYLKKFKKEFPLMTQWEIAEIIEVPRKTLGDWMRGDTVPHKVTFEGIKARLEKWKADQSNPCAVSEPDDETENAEAVKK